MDSVMKRKQNNPHDIMNESYKHYGEWTKPDTKEWLHDFNYMKF